MAAANSFYSPPTPLKGCQGPAHTAQRFSVSRQALTSLPPPRAARLPVAQRLRLLRVYGGISDVLQELLDGWDNDGGRRESLAPQQKRTQNLSCLSCQSNPSSPLHVNQNYTTSSGLSPGGGMLVTMSPLQNSLFMPRHNVSR